MTEKRKKELRQLLNEAIVNLEIGIHCGGRFLPIPLDPYRKYLQHCWTSYGVYSAYISWDIYSAIANEATISKLIEFIGEELKTIAPKNETGARIVGSFSYAIEGDAGGFRLSVLRYTSLCLLGVLPKHLLNIAIAYGIEEAVSAFDKCGCPEGTQNFFQDIASLNGIRLETETQVYEGVRLVPFPHRIPCELSSYLPGFPMPNFDVRTDPFMGKTLLIIDRPMFSVLRQALNEEPPDEISTDDFSFQVETHSIKFLNSDAVVSFRKTFCQALSLACNTPVQVARGWLFLPEDSAFHPFQGGGMGYNYGPFGYAIEVGQSEIDEAKHLYELLTNLDPDVEKKLQVAIDRWIKSKTIQMPEDKIIDLGIAFESLYVPAKLPGKSRKIVYNLKKNASRYLGRNKDNQEKLKKKFKVIYECRCDAAHEGRLKEKIEIEKDKHVPQSEFITEAQDLCRQSIIKILEDGKFPDWNSLILG